MMTFRSSSVDSVLQDIDEDDKFRRHVMEKWRMKPGMKKAYLEGINARDMRTAWEHAEANAEMDAKRLNMLSEDL